ncbi:F-box domain protein [Xylaria venustula]|nr:F-box domain protein [Xylaria venustula]
MAIPAFIDLPNELLDEIIQHSLPEGFESLALTCKELYALCTPFIKQHNHLRRSFRAFVYCDYPREPSTKIIFQAFDLIARIAAEPIVARYIIDANFGYDSFPSRARAPADVPDMNDGGPLATLFADSPYLARAGLDWREYYTLIEEELKQRPCYSQHAAAFVLTLLPNVKQLTLPKAWKPSEKTDRLLEAIVHEARPLNSSCTAPSLAGVAAFEVSQRRLGESPFDLNVAVPFLALPRLRELRSNSCLAIGSTSMSLTYRAPYRLCGEFLETANFSSCCFDEETIAKFLKHTPRLRTLEYSHMSRRIDKQHDWNLCEFVSAIEHQAGNHIEELAVAILHVRGVLIPGKASMRGFKRLRKFACPVELAMNHINKALPQTATANCDLKDQEPGMIITSVSDLIPASVSELSLSSARIDAYDMALEVFRDVVGEDGPRLPALKEIYLKGDPPLPWPRVTYLENCDRLAAKAAEAGVVFHIRQHRPEWNTTVLWHGQ